MIRRVCVVTGLMLLTCASSNANESASPAVRFQTDVTPVLTKLGCNSGGCHGKATGQNGFKLSLLGFDPMMDYRSIVKEGRGRRVSLASPDRSLLLRKAINASPHGGGQRTDLASEEYQLLKRWIMEGAAVPSETDPIVERISVSPESTVLGQQAKVRLKVTATFSDGSSRDVTKQAVYASNSPEVAEVNESGAVQTFDRAGLLSVMVRYGGKAATFHAAVPFASTGEDRDQITRRLAALDKELQRPLDRILLAQWKRLGVPPSDVADDAQFLRRASIDICGTLPTRRDVEAYVASRAPDKRERLIDRLLERPEYASYFALKWGDILQNRGSGYSTRKQRAGTALFAGWIRDSLAANKPYDQFVTEIVTASGSQNENPPTVWYRHVRSSTDYVESVAQAFLGVRIQCAQCHHHPFDRWSQGDYYGLAAVFARVGRKGGFADAEVPTNEVIFVKDSGDVVHPRSGRTMTPKALGGPEFQLTRFDDPRRHFATWMTAKENPFFARTMANRMWAHFLGRGVVHPLDDSRSTNPPSNPELLDALAAGFAESGYDVKQLIRTICNSYAYQLDSQPNLWNGDDTQTFARYYPRRLGAEVLLDAFSQVLNQPTQFAGGPGAFPKGTRAIELPDENVPMAFLDVFGRPARASACECERTDSPSLAQALALFNSPEIHRKLTSKDGYAANLATNNRTHKQNAEDVFFRVLGRAPSKQETQTAINYLKSTENKDSAYQSLLWSLIATNEFMFNH